MSTTTPPRPRRSTPTARRSMFGLAALLPLLALGVFATAALGSMVQTGVRAYVGGEGLWSKAQKDAVVHLERYVLTHDPAAWEAHQAEIAVTLGDRRARLELEKANPDDAVVLDGFVAGRNAAEDVPSMAMLFRTFRHLSYIDRAIAIWTQGDVEIDGLNEIAAQIHEAVLAGDQTALTGLMSQLDQANTRLTALEDAFSRTLGEGARWVQSVLLIVTASILVVLVAIIGIVGRLLVRRIRAADIEAAETLRASETRLRLLVDHLPAIVWTTDRDLVVVSMTGDGLARFELDADQLIGRSVPSLFNPSLGTVATDAAIAETAHREALAGQSGSYRTVLDGRTFQVHVEPMHVDNRIVGTIGLAIDLTERIELEERLERASRLESIGRLAGGVAHDFNNLLTAITGYADLLADGLPEGDQRRDAVEIQRAAQRGADLTSQLLAFGRRAVLKPEVIQPNTVVDEMHRMIRRLLGDVVQLHVDLDPNLPLVVADPGQLEQIILNLVVNARDAMPNGGTLTVATRRVRHATESGGAATDAAEIRVIDTGIGMDLATQARMFEPFFTTKPRGKGTGLGLATVYGLVDQSGGTIRVESAPGAGTTITIVLKSAEARRGRAAGTLRSLTSADPVAASLDLPGATLELIPAAPANAAAAVAEAPDERRTILVAEDEPAVRELVVHVLTGAGYDVRAAEDGRDALRIAGEMTRIDALVTDVIMPHTNGPDLAAALLAERPGLPVLFMSGYTGDVLGERGAIDPGVDLLAKPFKPTELLDRVSRALKGSGAGTTGGRTGRKGVA